MKGTTFTLTEREHEVLFDIVSAWADREHGRGMPDMSLRAKVLWVKLFKFDPDTGEEMDVAGFYAEDGAKAKAEGYEWS